MSSDPTTWGPQPNGFYCPNVQDVLGSVVNDQHQYVSADLDTDPDSPDGQNNGIFADRLAGAWDALRALDAAQSRDGAEGDLLRRQGVMTGTVWGAATTTKVQAYCILTTGTTLVAGTSLASIAGKPDVLFTPVTDYTAATDGTFAVLFESVETGPIPCPAGASGLTVIATPTTGWTGVSNSLAGVLGALAQTEAQFRLSQEEDLTRAGSSTALAMAVDVEQVAGVLSCKVLENYTDWLDGQGLPPHSVEFVVYQDGSASAALPKAIWEAKPAGIPTIGGISGTFTDSTGTVRTVHWSEVAQRPVYLSYGLTTGTGYVGDSALKDFVVSTLTGKAGPGIPLIALTAKSAPLTLAGVLDVPTFYLGFSTSPSGTANLTIGTREIATFDVARVVVL